MSGKQRRSFEFGLLSAGRPIVLGNAGPEDPDHHDGQEGEERFKKGAVDFALGPGTDVLTDHVLEYLADSEQKGGSEEVN